MFIQVEDDLDRIRNASSQQELMTSFKDFGRSVVELTDLAGRRQAVSTSVLYTYMYLAEGYTTVWWGESRLLNITASLEP